jgi:hypothetical protein
MQLCHEDIGCLVSRSRCFCPRQVDIFSLGVTLYEVLHSCIMVVVVSESEHSIEEGMRKYIRGCVASAPRVDLSHLECQKPTSELRQAH